MTPADERAAPERRLPRKIDAARLERAALFYLERYSSSSASLRRVLLRRIERVCRARGEDAAPYAPIADDIVRRAVASGLVDDRLYAQGKVASLRRRGQSARMIAAKLAARGIEFDLAAAAIASHDQARDTDDGAAALALARKRRLGPFRHDPAERSDRRDRDLAVLARAGYAYDIARRVIDGDGTMED